MGLWNLYFIIKLFLHGSGVLHVNPWLNLAFALALCLRLPARWARLERWHTALALAIGIALLYHESSLPAPARLGSVLQTLGGFTLAYWLELIARVVSLRGLLLLIALILAYALAARWIRVSSFVVLALLCLPLVQFMQHRELQARTAVAAIGAASCRTGPAAAQSPLSGDSLGHGLSTFFAKESARTVSFPPARRPMDIIFIHVCSLAWDDLRAIAQERHPLFARFDVLFKRFNSVATYSGPAAIRLLRGACGQSDHRGLYDPAPAQCYVMNDLQQAGFEPQLLMNHDGRFANFIDDVRVRGGLSAPAQDNGGVPVAMQAFDGSPIYDDYAELAQWWTRRQASGASRVTLYYNTISLHDGNRLVHVGGSSMSTYPRRTGKLLDDINRFVSLLESSGAHAIVVFVPEHGAAFRGDSGQVAGVREIPSERLTEIPVGVKFIGMPTSSATHPLNIEERMSYVGLNQLIAGALAGAGTAPNAAALPAPATVAPLDLATLTAGLAGTPYVAENDNLLVAEQDGHFFARDGSGTWLPAN